MMNGRVFDIRRFSTHDGDGIRTTAFLKGCPLCCVWCQNPEGISMEPRPLYMENTCIHCGTCIATGKYGGVVVDKNGRICLDASKEEDWNSIVDACPAGAIVMDSKEMSSDEVVEELKKDIPFFKYGGGITLSGGEPLAQVDFAVEILKKCKELGIHTSIETSLFAKKEDLEKVLPYLDSAFADMKIFDDTEHKKHVGVSNEIIKENLKVLLTSKIRDKLIIRTPMIPGFTTSDENIASISRFISSIYEDVSYEILNYNPLAQAKYHLVDKEYCFEKNPPLYTEEEMEYFRCIAKHHGIKRIK